MDFDEDPLDLLEDDGDGVNEMCLLFDKDADNKKKSSGSPQGTGCAVALLFMGAGVVTAGVIISKLVT